MNRLCVYCGSSVGASPRYADAAAALARVLVSRGIGVVYGGGGVGLMGVLADAMLACGGEVIGVIPRALLAREAGHRAVPDLRVVESMHERKAVMAELADGFVALPGGLGTMEELFESWTWAQLGIHAKPCALLNVGGFYDALLAFLEHARTERFLRDLYAGMLIVEDDPARLVERMVAYEPPDVPRWLTRAQE